jgi:hypothetical protein
MFISIFSLNFRNIGSVESAGIALKPLWKSHASTLPQKIFQLSQTFFLLFDGGQ